MALPYASGPQLLYVRFLPSTAVRGALLGAALSATGPALFLGTGEVGPQTEIRREWETAFNDLGSKTPWDLAYSGTQAFISVDLTDWNWAVYSALCSQPFGAGGVEGVNGPLETGALMLTEGLHHQLILVNTFGGKTVYSVNGMPAGHRFLGAIFAGPDRHQGGSRPYKLHVAWHCIPVFDRARRRRLLYDFNVSGLPNPN